MRLRPILRQLFKVPMDEQCDVVEAGDPISRGLDEAVAAHESAGKKERETRARQVREAIEDCLKRLGS